jgi:hypothetical protein
MWALVRPRPKLLYKFHTINDHLFDLLESATLYACSAAELNDPYDSDFDYHYDFIKKKYLDKITISDYNGTLSEFELNKAKNYIKKYPDNELFNLKMLHTDYKKSLGVCCFTTDLKSELMWSHYGQAGKGVCIAFSFPYKSEISMRLFQVKYSNKRIIAKNEISGFNALFHKRKAWQYESEWRILSEVGPINFTKSHLVSITFDPRCNDKERLAIMETCQKMKYNIGYSICLYSSKGIIIEKI